MSAAQETRHEAKAAGQSERPTGKARYADTVSLVNDEFPGKVAEDPARGT